MFEGLKLTFVCWGVGKSLRDITIHGAIAILFAFNVSNSSFVLHYRADQEQIIPHDLAHRCSGDWQAKQVETPLIELDGVSVDRGQTRILDRVSLQIPRHRHTCVLGPNGSGKSSLLKLLTREFYPSVEADGHQGTVRILGETNWQVNELRQRMGIVTPSLDNQFSRGRTGRMRVFDAVSSGYTATLLKDFGPQLDQQKRLAVDQAIELVGMNQFRDRTLSTLSTGERRRVMIARSMVHQPDIFVLDEPTNGLDMSAKASFLTTLDRLTRQKSMTIVLVTHHVDEIPPDIGHLILLDSGRVSFDGPSCEGLTSERISRQFGIPVEVRRQENRWYSTHAATEA